MTNKIDIVDLETSVVYTFRKKKYRTRALTRRAYAKEQEDLKKKCEDQEAFCVLGDAVLKAILTDRLIEKRNETRKDITEKKQELENQTSLKDIALDLGIDDFILTNKGEKKTGADKQPRVLAETLEAIIGAMFLDSDYGETKKTVLKWFPF